MVALARNAQVEYRPARRTSRARSSTDTSRRRRSGGQPPSAARERSALDTRARVQPESAKTAPPRPTTSSNYIDAQDRRTMTGQLRAGADPRAAANDNYGPTSRYDRDRRSGLDRTQRAAVEYQAAANAGYAPGTDYSPSNVPVVVRNKKSEKKRSVEKKVATKAAVTAINAPINAAAGTFYLLIQLPFAILSTVGVGAAAYVYSVAASFGIADSAIGRLLQGTFGTETITGTFSKVVKVITGIYLGIEIDPIMLFLIGILLVFCIGLLCMSFCWLAYSIAGVRSLSGKWAAGKIALFIFACIGLFIPVINLLPWVNMWTAVVWLRPN